MNFNDGLYPVMLTPFSADGTSVDYAALKKLTEWYIQSGSVGLFPVAQSGEMFHLSNEERLLVAQCVKDTAAGRVPIIATGTFGGSIAEMAEFCTQMGYVSSLES
jgi:4-hydroxy-tetrahydrodipicolinate synthase